MLPPRGLLWMKLSLQQRVQHRWLRRPRSPHPQLHRRSRPLPRLPKRGALNLPTPLTLQARKDKTKPAASTVKGLGQGPMLRLRQLQLPRPTKVERAVMALR